MLQPDEDEREIVARHEAVLGGQPEMGQEGEVRTGVDAFQSTVLSQSLHAVSEHVVPRQTHATSSQTLVCLPRKKQMKR